MTVGKRRKKRNTICVDQELGLIMCSYGGVSSEVAQWEMAPKLKACPW